MQNNNASEQYAINIWCQFKDQKIAQFFKKQTSKIASVKNYYFNFSNILALLIIKFYLKNNEYSILTFTLFSILVHLLLISFNKVQKLQNILILVIDLSITTSILSKQWENDNEFLIRLTLISIIQTTKSMISQYDWLTMFLTNTFKISSLIILRWIIIKDYNSFKIIAFISIICFLQILQVIIVAIYSYSYKKQWAMSEKIKKNYQMLEKLIFELPVALVLFDQKEQVIYQNSISFKFLPKEIDLITKQYLNEQLCIDRLLLSEENKNQFKQIYQEALNSEDTFSISFAFQGYPIPINCQLRKQIFFKHIFIEAIFIEKSDDQSIIYDRISQSQQILKIQQLSEIMSKQQEKLKQNLLQTLFPMLSRSNYFQTDSLVCNVKNYFKFFADFLQISFKINPNIKIENDVPDQALLDLVKLHGVLTQLISYIYMEYQRKQLLQKSGSQRQLIQNSTNEKSNQKEQNNFSLISFNILKEEDLQITIQIDYQNQIQELELLFTRFDFDSLKLYEYRVSQLLEEDLTYTTFIHILHQIYQVGGKIELIEKVDNIKIQINIPITVVSDYQQVFLDNYNGLGKFDTITKLYQTNLDLTQNNRIKSSTQIPSTTRIAQVPQIVTQKIIEESGRIQTSLSEMKQFSICKLQDISYRPNVISEEEKCQAAAKISSPNLSPINKPSTLAKQGDVANLDIEDKINTQMHQVEKAVSKVLEQVLQEIMTFKGKRINVHFKNSKQKQKSFETSPSTSSAQQQTQRNTSTPNLQQFRTTIPEQKEPGFSQQQINQKQQYQLSPQHPQSLFQQYSQNKGQNEIHQNSPAHNQNNQNNQNQLSSNQQIPSSQNRKNQLQIFKSLRETDQGNKIQHFDDTNKMEETCEDLKGSIKYMPMNQDEHLQKSQHSQTSLSHGNGGQNNTQGSEKSPCFLAQKQLTINDIDSLQPPILKQDSFADIKQYYNQNISILMYDDSNISIQEIINMKFQQEKCVDSSKRQEDILKKLEIMFKKNLIYHLIIIRISLVKKDDFKLIKDIRALEIKYKMPKQYIIGIEINITAEITQICYDQTIDEVQCQPLKYQFLQQFINQRLGIQEEQNNQIQQSQILPDITSFQEIKQQENDQIEDSKIFYESVFTIFLLDDSQMTVAALTSMKFCIEKKMDYARKSDDGIKKIEQFLQNKKIYHLIFLKLNLAGINGFEVLKKIRDMEIQYKVPKQYVVGIDMEIDEQLTEKCINAGFNSVMQRPLDLRKLDPLVKQRISEIK